MLYCLKCKKIQRVKTQESQRLVMGNNDSVKLCSAQQKKKNKNYQRTRGQRIVKSIRNQNSYKQDTIIGWYILFRVHNNEQYN